MSVHNRFIVSIGNFKGRGLFEKVHTDYFISNYRFICFLFNR